MSPLSARTTSRPGWVAGVQVTGRPQPSGGSRSSSWRSPSAASSAPRPSIAEKSGNGESGKAASIAYDQFRHTARGERPDPEHDAHHRRHRLQGRSRRRGQAIRRQRPTSSRSTPRTRPATRGRSRRDRHSALVTFKLRTKDLTKADEHVPALLATTAALQQAHPAVTIERSRRRVDRQADQRRLRQGPRKGRPALASGHAPHPVVRLRRARCCGHPAAAGAHLGVRDDGPDRRCRAI